MFTGIIKEIGIVKDVVEENSGRRITIAAELVGKVSVDQSININGVCHTAVDVDEEEFTIQSVEETLCKTNIGSIEMDDMVNLELSLHSEQLLDGHLVQGHIDAVGKIEAVEEEQSDRLFTISFPDEFKDLIVPQGSIAVDGISLTIAEARQTEFTVAAIPYTNEHTLMQYRQPGDTVNLEFDILGKYVARYLANRS